MEPAPLGPLTLAEASRRMAAGEFASERLARACLERIRAVDGGVNAFRSLDADGALAAARASDRRRRESGCLGPLDGIPVSLKDNISARGMPATCSCRLLEDYTPPFDAFVVGRLKAAGAVILGKTNLDELGMGSTSENGAWGPVRNPWNPSRVAGGSSGGAAAAAAYGGGLAALGTDTGGSARVPAAFCGLVACKPTYGLVSRWGLAALASSMDAASPMARTALDCALLLDAISGHDPRDAASRPGPAPKAAEAVLAQARQPAAALRGARLGWPPAVLESLPAGDPFRSVWPELRSAAEGAGARFIETPLPDFPRASAAAAILIASEAFANMARLNGLAYGRRGGGADWLSSVCQARGQGLGHEAKRRILFGAYALSEGQYEGFYVKAARVRRLIASQLAAALGQCDALVLPVAPGPPPLLGQSGAAADAVRLDHFTAAANLAGLPSLAMPVGGLPAGGCPAGAQWLGRAGDEPRLLALAAALEAVRPDWTFPAMAPRMHAQATARRDAAS